MIRQIRPVDPDAPIVVIDIGNTNTGLATWHLGTLRTPLSVPTGDAEALDQAFAAHVKAAPSRLGAAVIGSVVPEALSRIRKHVSEVLEQDALVVGDGIPVPIDVRIENLKGVGMDRICAAAAAFDTLQAACTIVDFGTAVTVDLCDDDGTLLGGAILPGPRMQLRALHEYTAVLPEVTPGVPDCPFGRNTVEAMQTGVCRGLVGAVRGLVEGYATYLTRWPQVVATGGDASFLAPHCDFLDNVVPYLTLRGIGLAYSKYLAAMGA